MIAFILGFIKELSKYIGVDWKPLARSVGLTKTDIEAISHDYHSSLEEQIYQFFEKWKQQNGRNATVQKLKDGLRDANLLKKLQKAGFPLKGLWLPIKLKIWFSLLRFYLVSKLQCTGLHHLGITVKLIF